MSDALAIASGGIFYTAFLFGPGVTIANALSLSPELVYFKLIFAGLFFVCCLLATCFAIIWPIVPSPRWQRAAALAFDALLLAVVALVPGWILPLGIAVLSGTVYLGYCYPREKSGRNTQQRNGGAP